ncbi:ATP-binding protein [Ekhidna sp.]|uniref:sensor histidine kinase n=1 Tax=Ekhidna sp. TaxID=2608089 RepID=UPI0032995B3D
MKRKAMLSAIVCLVVGISVASNDSEKLSIKSNFIEIDEVTLCKTPSAQIANPTLTSYFKGLFSTENWPARWTCGDWSQTEGWLYISSDISIFLAYLSISIMLLWFIRKIELGKVKWLISLFGTFILLCGFTHLIDVVLFWEPMYRFSGFTKLLTGVVSLTTATVLGFVIPKALEYKSPEVLQAEIDERKKIQNQFELFVKYSPGAVAMLDNDLNFIIVNEGWIEDYTLEESSILDKNYFDVFPDSTKDLEWVKNIRKALEGESTKADFDTYEGKNGTEYLRWQLRPWYDANDQIGGVIIFTELITEEVLIQKKLKEMNERFSEISNMANIGTWEVDLEQSRCYWSETIYKIHEEEIGKLIRLEDGINYYHPDHRDLITNAIEEAISTKKSWDLELKIITAKDTEKWVRAIGRAIYENGEAKKLQGLFQDIDIKKRYELDVKESKKELEEIVSQRTIDLKTANEELESFSYSVSHDLRAPLRAINGFSEALIEDYSKEIPDEASKYLNRIAANASKMGGLIDDLLEFSRMNRKKVNHQELNLVAMINQVVDDIFPESKSILEVGDLPTISGDQMMLTQVFTNLISNAIKYSSKEENPQVVLSSIEEKDSVVISVKDNGAGFNMDYYDKLFQVFQRLHTESEFEGTGVGLALCSKIMKSHDGEIWAESEQGKGATFFLRFKKI